MSIRNMRGSDLARVALACIRLFIGTAALVAPRWLERRFGVDPDANPSAPYIFRLFGIRTIMIGADLLTGSKQSRASALRKGVLIHVSDAAAVLIAGKQGQLPRRTVITAVLTSTVNTALALIAQTTED
jgi:hypothetical protein